MENVQETPNFDLIKIGLANTKRIHELSFGEVTKPETINYRTLKPEPDGLFCEKIFGPTKDYECHCGKYKKIRYKGKICEKCGVEVTKSKVRRDRMGHIDLVAPVSHIWYFKGTPSRIALMLDVSPKDLEHVLYFSEYIVIEPGDTELEKKQILSELEYEQMRELYEDAFDAQMGAEAIERLLSELDPAALVEEIRAEIEELAPSSQKRQKLIKRLDVAEAFKQSGQRPENMILNVVPVIPPELRPMVQLDGGRFATSDLNDLYRRVINRNNRLKKLLEQGAPDIIVRNEKRMLQEAVDSLIENGKHGRVVTGPSNRPLKSLSDMLKGKQGRFRQNLLGKRVDYSGRSVIVVGPELKMHQCGLPQEMALELFKPFVMKRLMQQGIAINSRAARKMVEKGHDPRVWDALEIEIKDHPVLLNRAPTLHRLSIQAYEPILVPGKAIKLHPLSCTAFNADFDGDQMAVHVPLSIEAQAEARLLMLGANNLLKPADGEPVTVPTQDMILGSYYLTVEDDTVSDVVKFKNLREFDDNDDEVKYNLNAFLVDENGERITDFYGEDISFEKTFVVHGGKAEIPVFFTFPIPRALAGEKVYIECVATTVEKGFDDNGNEIEETITVYDEKHETFIPMPKIYSSVDEAIEAYQLKFIGLHEQIRVRIKKTMDDGAEISAIIPTTVGRVIFNEPIPQDLGFVDRKKKENKFRLEVEFLVGKSGLSKLINACIKAHGINRTTIMLDAIKAQGYKYSTVSGMTFSVADAKIPDYKWMEIDLASQKVDSINTQYMMGLFSKQERSKHVIETWEECTERVSSGIKDSLGKDNPIFVMIDSGARGNASQLRQFAGMRGLIANTAGETIEVPIRANYREGLNVMEYFISSRGARKGLADTAIRTSDSGYLTRRLVDVSQELIVNEDDCHCCDGLEVSDIKNDDGMVEPLSERLIGRFLLDDFKDEDGKLIHSKDEMISDEKAKVIADLVNAREDIKDRTIKIRSLLTCESEHGVCAKCYGKNLARAVRVNVGESVGVIAAQSIGEPGTQLTMRNFHTGGALGSADITQGLPRVEELFEARRPKVYAILTEIPGYVTITRGKRGEMMTVTDEESGEIKKYQIPYGFNKREKFKNIPIGMEDETNELPDELVYVEKGEALTEGAPDPKDVLRILGLHAVQNYIIDEVQKTYRGQGVDINDKHIEVIVRQMMRKVVVESAGSTELVEGATMNKTDVDAENARVEAVCEKEGRDFVPATAEPQLLGVTKAALATDSFLSAASFQETSRVLTDAAVKGKEDYLRGLKENVIIGKLLPAGTGTKMYQNAGVEKDYHLPEGVTVSSEE
ncbi:MAG: DNA-directed RNA polymerase subunit beta' [Candidatus Fimenecus sp.]